MTENIKNSPDYIVANEILFKEGTFTIDDILADVREKLLDKVFSTIDQLIVFVKNKISSLCEVGLITYTGLFYYVN